MWIEPDSRVRDSWRCPVTHTALVDGTDSEGNPELVNTSSEQPLAYPVRNGVPVLLADEARAL